MESNYVLWFSSMFKYTEYIPEPMQNSITDYWKCPSEAEYDHVGMMVIQSKT